MEKTTGTGQDSASSPGAPPPAGAEPASAQAALSAGQPASSAGRAAPWFFLILVFAFVIRLIYLTELNDNPLFEHPIMDARIHHEWAEQFAAGEEWSIDRRTQRPIPYFRAPLYIWFLGTIYKVFGVDPGMPPRLIQSLLGALSCGLIFLLGRRLFGKAVGITAGFAASLCWTLVYFDNELLLVPLIIFLDLLCLLLLVAAHDRQKWYLWSAAGLFLGLSAIARPNILLFAPAVCLWILYTAFRAGKIRRAGIPHCFAFGFALLLPILPITARNWIKGDNAVLIASQGGVNFFIGNNPRTDGVTAVVPGTPNDWWGGYYATREMARHALGRDPKPSEVSSYFFGEAIRFWKEETGKALYAFFAKVRFFFSRQEFANNKCIYTFTEEFTPFVRWLVVGYWIVAPLGLLGLFLSLRRGARLFPLWGFFAVYSLSVILFFITARFRMPAVPVLIIYAAFALFWLIGKARARDFRRLLPALAALGLLFPLVLHVPGPGGFRVFRVSEELFCTLGTELWKQGDTNAAIAYYDRAADLSRKRLEKADPLSRQVEIAHRGLSTSLLAKGKILEGRNRLPDALAAYGEALSHIPSILPEKVQLLEKIAEIFTALGAPREAAEHRREAQRLREEQGKARPSR